MPSAYIQADISDGDIVYYITQPEGFKDPEHSKYLCRLNKALYGMPIAGQCWNLTFQKFLIEELQFHCLTADPNLYICVESDRNFCLFPTVVDDNLDVCTCPKLHEEIYSKLIERFKWKPSGKCFWFLGCGVKQNHKEISLNQCAFLNNLLESFDCYKIRKSNTPAMSKVLLCLSLMNPLLIFPMLVLLVL